MMIPLFDSESFAFIGSADGELIVNCRQCRHEAEAQIDTIKIALSVTCPACGMTAEFKFRPSVHISPSTKWPPKASSGPAQALSVRAPAMQPR